MKEKLYEEQKIKQEYETILNKEKEKVKLTKTRFFKKKN